MDFFKILKGGVGVGMSNFDRLFAEKHGGGAWQLTTLTGTFPLTFQSKGTPLTDYKLYGTSEGAGVETENKFIEAHQGWYFGGTSGSTIAQGSGSYGILIASVVAGKTYRYPTPMVNYNQRPMVAFFEDKPEVGSEPFDGKAEYAEFDYGPEPSKVAGNSVFVAPITGYVAIQQRKDLIDILPLMVIETTDFYDLRYKGYTPPGFKLSMTVESGEESTTTPIYIGNSKLGEEEYVDYGEQKIYKTINIFNKDTAERYELGQMPESDSVSYSRGAAMFFVEAVQNVDYTLKVESNTTPPLLRLYRSDNPLQHLSNTATSIPYTEVKNAISGENVVSINSGNSRYIWLQFSSNWWQQQSSTATILFYTEILQPTDPPVPLPDIPTYKGENTMSCSEGLGEISITGYIKGE